ncbi:hypothetical protein P9294_gp092 [Bacillus phage FADO]|uniref:Uncharacterized protein n=1 Tax=Bacillus phage FADO TaxID=2917160 RepID=A0AAE9GAJ3_9CAUD|nr:hypothetical protein P9294_gp092 [Bacillus phage FADO]UNY48807.1 hypothetical protein fado_92 [Bacillus phage FADO]
MSENKSYTLHGHLIEKTERGYRVYKEGKLMARKSTLELAKDWIRENR